MIIILIYFRVPKKELLATEWEYFTFFRVYV
jgi:hypothetical protein